jgi:hypothetical protein
MGVRIRLIAMVFVLGIGMLAGCATSPPPSGGPVVPTAPSADAGCRGPEYLPRAGDVVCYTEDLDEVLMIMKGGQPGAPIVHQGTGSTKVPGIHVEADNVVVEGFVSEGAQSTGIWTRGKNVTIQDNTITKVYYVGDDVDAIRFFGDGTKVLRNTVRDLEANAIADSHVDCIQTFAIREPSSQDVVIQGNRCEGIRAQCRMAEGPNDEYGSGQGVSRNWVFQGNYCDAYAAAQSVALEDVQNVTIAENQMVGKANKAFALGKGSTGVTVRSNQIGPGYGREVGFDDPSAQEGYQGPAAR